ncbi:MAG TPA: hypothetical protein VGE07_06305 [Herpetosiphonaceae bacterium]
MPQPSVPRTPTRRAILLWLLLGLLAANLPGRPAASQIPAPEPTLPVRQIKAINPGWNGSDPKLLTKVGNRMFFTAERHDIGRELWISDGTADGTQLVSDLTPGGESTSIGQIGALGGAAYFTVLRADGFELWRSDGTAAGTGMVRAQSGALPASNMAELGGRLYFFAQTTGQPIVQQLWRTDGTAAGTRSMAQINLGPNYSASIARLDALNGALYAWSERYPDQYGEPRHAFLRYGGGALQTLATCDCEPFARRWWQDGPAASPSLVATMLYGTHKLLIYRGNERREIDLGPLGLRQIGGFIADGDHVLFGATHIDGRLGFWRTDGTAAGTVAGVQLKTDLQHYEQGVITNLTRFDGLLYFSYSGSLSTLWRTDGTAAGTRPVASFKADVSAEGWLRAVGGKLFMPADDMFGNATGTVYGRELWMLGARDAPLIVADANPGPRNGIWRQDLFEVIELPAGIVWSGYSEGNGNDLRLLPRAAAPYVAASGAIGPGGGAARVRLRFGNGGFQASAPQTLTLSLPPDATLIGDTVGTAPTISDNTARWALGELPVAAREADLIIGLPEAPFGTRFGALIGLEPAGGFQQIILTVGGATYLPQVAGP